MKSQILLDKGYFQGFSNLKNTKIQSGRYKGRESENSQSIPSDDDNIV